MDGTVDAGTESAPDAAAPSDTTVTMLDDSSVSGSTAWIAVDGIELDVKTM